MLVTKLILLCFLLSTYANTVNLYDNQVNLTYFVDNDYLYLTLTHNYNSWLAIGWHSPTSSSDNPSAMYNADFVIAQFNNNGSILSVLDYVTDPNSIDGETRPVLDTTLVSKNCTNDIIYYSAFQSPAGSTFSFKRLLVTNDSYCDRPITNQTQLIVWARGLHFGDNTLSYHGSFVSTHGFSKINFIGAQTLLPSTTAFNYIPLHASLMFIAFVILIPFTIFIAHHLKQYPWWFHLHISVSALTLIFVIIALVFAIKSVTGLHLITTHSKLGLTTLCLCLVNVLLGIISERTYNPRQDHNCRWQDLSHKIFAYLTVLSSWVTIILGIILVNLDKTVVIVSCCLFIFYVVLYHLINLIKYLVTRKYTLV